MSSATGRSATLFPGIGPALLLVLAALALQVGCGIFIAASAAIAGRSLKQVETSLFNPWSLGAANVLSLGAVIAFALKRTKERPAGFLAIRPFSPGLMIPIVLSSLGLGIVLDQTDNILVDLLRHLPGLGDMPLDLEAMALHPIGTFWALVVVAPLTEEYLFRRMILRGLISRHGAWPAIIATAVMFGVMHANIRQLFLGVAVGALFGWWYHRTTSVGPCILGHALFNAVAAIATVFPGSLPLLGHLGERGEVVYQPWWLTLIGAGATGAGIWMFHQLAPRSPPPDIVEVPEPPLLAAADEPPMLAAGLAPESPPATERLVT